MTYDRAAAPTNSTKALPAHAGQAFSLPQTGDEQAKAPAPPGIQHKALCKAHER